MAHAGTGWTACSTIAAPEESPKSVREKRDESWRALLTPEDMPLFQALRDWRNERSRREGIPPYLICTNKQTAEMVARRVAKETN